MPEIGSNVVVPDQAVKPVRTKRDVRLNDDQDIDILEMVRDATFITKRQLKHLRERRGVTRTRSTFNWRLNRLVECELIVASPKPVFPFKGTVYSIGRTGLGVLEHYGKGLASIGSESEHLASFSQALHFLELNEITFQFDRSFKLEFAMCDRVIRARNLAPQSPLAKDYDMLLKIDRSEIEKEALNVAVEYERSVKSNDRYSDISDALSHERHVRLIVYMCGSTNIADLLADKIRPRSVRVCFMASASFLRDGAETKAIFVQDGKKHSVTLKRLIEQA